MPYVDYVRRANLSGVYFVVDRIETIGDLTYVIYVLCLSYIKRVGVSYATYASVLGALTATIQELYRKEIAEYEDEKEEMNGEIRL